MPENSEGRESPTMRRKRLRYRSWHRGTKELDLLLGGFADQQLDAFDEAQLDRFEALLAVPDPVIQAWLVSRVPPPAAAECDVLRLLLDHKLPVSTR
jgi:antitoxin CptB